MVPDGISHSGSVYSVSFSPDGGSVLTSSGDGLAQVFDARSGKLLLRIETPPDCDGQRCRLRAASWRPDGRQIATASDGKKACIWDTQGSSGIGGVLSNPVLCVRHDELVYSVSWDGDGGQIVTTSGDRTAIVWDAQTGRDVVTFYGEDFDFRSAEFLVKGAFQQVMTRNGDRALRFWDMDTSHPVAKVTHRQSFLTSAVMDKSGERLVTAATDGTARIWTLSSFDALAEIARARIPRCLSHAQRQRYNFNPGVQPIPTWCTGKLHGPPTRSEIARQ